MTFNIGYDALDGVYRRIEYGTPKKFYGGSYHEKVLPANQKLVGAYIGWGGDGDNPTGVGSIHVGLYDQSHPDEDKPLIPESSIIIPYDNAALASGGVQWIGVDGLDIDFSEHAGKTLVTGAATAKDALFSVVVQDSAGSGKGTYRINSVLSNSTTLPDPFVSVLSADGNRSWSLYFQFEDIGVSVPTIISSGTDKSLVLGETHSIAFSGLASPPTTLAINNTQQLNFIVGEVVDGFAEATFTASIGNAPYTDINNPPQDYSYIVTCEDGSELTLSGISISPPASRNLVTANNPVNDSTSIIFQWIEGLAQTGDQIDYPKQVENVTLTVNPDFTHTGVVPEGEEFPSSASFDINYWDSVSGERYPVTIELSFKETNSEILEFVPSSTDAISVEFFASSEGFVNELVPSSTDSIVIFYGEKLFTPSLSRTLHIKP